MGEVAMRSLINLLNGIPDSQVTNSLVLSAELVIRASSVR
jgi:DNA-binding LacI/PurR family transcriptional regulator